MSIEVKLNLTEEEQNMMEAFVASPVYPLLKRVCNAQKESSLGGLRVAKELIDIGRYQGTLNGIDFVQNIPGLIAKLSIDRKAKDRQAKEKHGLKLKKPPA